MSNSVTARRRGEHRAPPCSSSPGLRAPAGGARARGGRAGSLPPTGGSSGSTFLEPSSPLPVPASAPTLLNTEPVRRMPCRDWGLPPSPVLGWQGPARKAGAEKAQGIADLEATEGCACAKNNTHGHRHTHTHTHTHRLTVPSRGKYCPEAARAREPYAEI